MKLTQTLVSLTACVLLTAVTASAQTPAAPKHHAVIQLNEPEGDAWGTLVIHVENMRAAFEKDGGVQIEVVFFGPGVNMLRKTNTAEGDRLKLLYDNGVILAACQNAMRAFNLKTEDLFPFAAQVDAGVAEVVRKQEAGWAYLH
jgi:intracellular sulfur oxidation DsrE/DsrF family protein